MNPTISVFTSVHTPDDPRIREKSLGTLLDRGWRVTYVCRAPGPSNNDGFAVRTLNGGRVARSLKAVWHMVTSRSDVVVVHDPELLLGAIPLGWICGKNRVVFDLHESLPDQLRSRRRTPAILRTPTARLSLMVLRAAESAVTVTLAEPGYQALFRYEHPVFENLPAVGSLPRRSPDAHGIVYVGDITRERGATVLVEAVGMLETRQRLTMIGRCDAELKGELEAAAEASGLELVMPGFLSYAQAWSLAADSLVGVSPLNDLPNYRHSLPTKIVEYRSVGLLAVVSDLPASLTAIEGSDVARSFTAGDAGHLSSVLGEVLGDTEARQIATLESAMVRESATWPAEDLDAFYRSLIA